MPSQDYMHQIMRKHLGETDCFSYDESVAGFVPKEYLATFENGKVETPPLLMITGCSDIKKPIMDSFDESQLCDCSTGKSVLDSCKYQVIASDMMSIGLSIKDRSELLVHYIEALAEIYPECKAIVFENSKKMLTRDDIINCDLPEESRFLYYVINVRLFNIEGTNDFLVDSVGMSTLHLPDLQYHFHDVDPNDVVNHAYNVLSYIIENENPIKNGDVIDGLYDGCMSQEIQWKTQYEESLLPPVREVLDINMGEYAAGERA